VKFYRDKMMATDKTVVITCLTPTGMRALYIEWEGDLDTITTMCKDQWGEGLISRRNDLLYDWKLDGSKKNARGK
jgi:hypothetical protein